MSKIKHTKTELKAQNEGLRRFQRFLPMLILKKQQLQAEIQRITIRIEEKEAEEQAARDGLKKWVKIFSDDYEVDNMISIENIETEEGNIAGVNIPVFKSLQVAKKDVDLFASPTWVDDAMDVIEQLSTLRVEKDILWEQRRLISEELRTTSQRVNLFEKVKIPECKENIRVIKIFLGDEQTASVVRGKIAKRRSETE